MQNTHIFIVDTNTFKYHLEYQFAGTGAAPSDKKTPEYYIDFNSSPNTAFRGQLENNLVSMIADSQRVREGDFVIFYLQQNAKQGIFEGKFYGIFKVKGEYSFLDNRDNKQFLKNELIKSLTFRTLIEPHEVYPQGVTEWEALDEIKNIHSPYQMLWSLIYRKLKGNRGNTMITIYESERLCKLLRDKNHHLPLNRNDFTFDLENQLIQSSPNHHIYTGRQEPIDIFPRLRRKLLDWKAFECHLQTFIVQNINRNTNQSLDSSILEGLYLDWLGNEVSCGVGMQRIDILLDTTKDIGKRVIMPIELKACESSPDNTYQIQRYVNWLEQYYVPNRVGDIQPVLISLLPSSNGALIRCFEAFSRFNSDNPNCLPLKYVVYKINNSSIEFGCIDYTK